MQTVVPRLLAGILLILLLLGLHATEAGTLKLMGAEVLSGSSALREETVDVIANSIDRDLAGKELEDLAGKNGIRIVYHNSSEADDLLKKKRNLVILGGPDAYEGVGNVVRSLLTDEETERVRESVSSLVFEKRNPYNGGTVYIIAGSTRNDTKAAVGMDHDADGLKTGVEVLLFNHPLKKSYGLKELMGELDVSSLRLLGGIDEDGKVDDNERVFLDFVENVAHGKWIDEKYRKWFWSEARTVTSKPIPVACRELLWPKEELKGYAGRLVKSVMEDGKVSEEEAEAIRYVVENYRWEDGRGGLVFDLIDGKALSDENLGKDFDGDGYTNFDEIKEGFNPFNKWEYPGGEDGYTRVFYVGVNGVVFRYAPLAPFFIPMMMLKYGIKPENMKILVQEWKGSKIGTLRDWKDTDWPQFGWFRRKNVYKIFRDVGGELYGLDETTTPERFLQAINETVRQMDGNDVLIVYYGGHGPDPGIVIYDKVDYEWFSWKDVAKIIEGGKGHKIVIIDSCYAENAIRNNFNLSSAYFIGTSRLNEETGGTEHIITISTRMGKGYKVKEWYNKANVCEDGSCEIGEINPVKWVKTSSEDG